jgi:hypothetical protein
MAYILFIIRYTWCFWWDNVAFSKKTVKRRYSQRAVHRMTGHLVAYQSAEDLGHGRSFIGLMLLKAFPMD